jgi:hypothetical protein
MRFHCATARVSTHCSSEFRLQAVSEPRERGTPNRTSPFNALGSATNRIRTEGFREDETAKGARRAKAGIWTTICLFLSGRWTHSFVLVIALAMFVPHFSRAKKRAEMLDEAYS